MQVKKIHVTDLDIALAEKFLSSPTIRLYTVTHSVLIDYYRKQNRKLSQDMVIEELSAPPEQSEPEFDECLSLLVNNLPDKYRDAVKFVDMNGGRQTELAIQAGFSHSTAKSRVQRGRKMLKSAILNCCRVELDGFNNEIAVEPKDHDQKNCC